MNTSLKISQTISKEEAIKLRRLANLYDIKTILEQREIKDKDDLQSNHLLINTINYYINLIDI